MTSLARVTHHLVRRGHISTQSVNRTLSLDEVVKQITNPLLSPISFTTLLTTFLIWFIVATAFDYTIGCVIESIVIVESSDTDKTSCKATRLLLEKKDEGKKDLSYIGRSARPITGSICSTLKLLSQVGGFKARFRGFHAFMIYSVVTIVTEIPFVIIFSPFPFGRYVAIFITTALCARLHCAWIHAMIRAPTKSDTKLEACVEGDDYDKKRKTCTNRSGMHYISSKDSRRLILPTIRYHASLVVCELLTTTVLTVKPTMLLQQRGSKINDIILPALGYNIPILVFVLALLLLVVPSAIALVRIEASLLPESDDAIVPLDRSFGGRIDHTKEQSRLATVMKDLTPLGAWMMFDRTTFFRVASIEVVDYAIQFALGVALGLALAFETYHFTDENGKVLLQALVSKLNE